MRREYLTSRNAFFIYMIFIVSNNLILGTQTEVEQDSWLALLVSTIFFVPLMALYGRMLKLMPGRDIYEMAEITLGKIGCRVICVVFGFYCFHLAALALGNYAMFVHLTSLFKTPFSIIVVVLFLACLYLAKSGVRTVGKWCTITGVVLTIMALLMLILSFNIMDYRNLMPMFDHGIGETAKAAWKIVRLPFGESVILLGIYSDLEKGKKSHRVPLYGALFSLSLMLVIFIRTCCVMGVKMMDTAYFPSYKAASLITVGSFFERIEAFLAFVYILAWIGKVAICLISSARGMAKLFAIQEYNGLILPLGFLCVALAIILFHNIVEMFNFIPVYLIYVVPMQIVIPLLIWIVAEVKARRGTLPAPPERPDQNEAEVTAYGSRQLRQR